MILAIDYDDTYSTFKEELSVLRDTFQQRGHKVYLVTARSEKFEAIDDPTLNLFDKVIYTNGKAKASVVRADLWIDDNPVTLCMDFVQGEPHAMPGQPLHQGYKNKHILWNWENDRFVSYIKKPFNIKKGKDE